MILIYLDSNTVIKLAKNIHTDIFSEVLEEFDVNEFKEFNPHLTLFKLTNSIKKKVNINLL